MDSFEFGSHINEILSELEKTKSQFWNISRDTAQLLYILAKSLRSEKILEIGTSNGYSAIWLALALKSLHGDDTSYSVDILKDRKIFTVESHKERFELARENFVRTDLSTFIVQVKGHAPEILFEIDEIKTGNFDLVFLDATKAEHISYLGAIFPLVKEGGFIIADNILSHSIEMQPYLEYAKRLDQLESIILPVGAGLMLSRKI